MRYRLSDHERDVIDPVFPNTPARSVAKNSAEATSQRPLFALAASVSRAELDRTVLKQNQATSACRERYKKFAANYLAFIKLASTPKLATR
jgi:hypothetical protein